MRRLVVVLVAIALSVAACGGSDDSAESGGGSPPVSLAGTTNDHGTAAATANLAMELDDFYFGPTFVSATAGQTFTLELENEGKEPHTFTSTALGIDEQLEPGQKRTVRVTAPQSGVALVTCRIHQALGMQGAIFVK
jgi:plastocyanin